MTEPKKEDLTNPSENIDVLKQQIASISQERDNVVGELKEDREKRRLLNEEIETLKAALTEATQKNVAQPDAGNLAEVVKTVLSQELSARDASIAKGNKVAAIERFVNQHKEFHADNDTTGKRREALENALKRFNTDGLVSVEQFYAVVADAARLLGTDTAPTNPAEVVIESPYSSAPRYVVTPKVADDPDVTPKERKLAEQNGWTIERYKKLRSSQPAFVDSLLQHVR